MPTYDFRCKDCGHEFDVVLTMNEPRPKECPRCEGELRRVIVKPMIAPDIAPYQSIVTGEMISGRKAHREHLLQTDCVEIGDQQTDRQKAYKQSEFEQKLDWHREKGKPVPPESVTRNWSKDY